ncbi:MAG: hypothetical protein ACJA01_002455 [Saprospiraceae bacterium]|jgi:hypothetical protein
MTKEVAEKERLAVSKDNKTWKKWGPYLAERQWGTVREDYSKNGGSWDHISHDMARSNTYRWGEEGIGGYCDMREILCLAPAFWNGKDSIIKERLFGLTNGQGNHGEDVKELYFHLESTPTHSYSKYLYKYPISPFPYTELVESNRRSRHELEFEILDTGVFNDNKYFDCYIEYAKADVEEILMQTTVINRSDFDAELHVVPHVWYRNFWKHNPSYERPTIRQIDDHVLEVDTGRDGIYYYHFESGTPLFCENETNNPRVHGSPADTSYPKDGINDHIINNKKTINPKHEGSKVGIWNNELIETGGQRTYRIRLSRKINSKPWRDFNDIIELRKRDTEEFYGSLISKDLDIDIKHILRSAFGGLLWTKQFYYYDVHKWLFGGPGETPPKREFKRNASWQHMTQRNIISMPDKWEYPWYAAWDLAFHTSTFAFVDPDFAKDQLLLMLSDHYMHPNGQIPAYEWNFSDVNPPVHSWAVWDVYEKDKEKTGVADYEFLSKCFQKLLINFTWWVNQKDKDGTSLFEGGFLGLDNIGVFDRNHMPPGIKKMQQSDATSWMAMFSLNMFRMSVELCNHDLSYEESASKFFRQFLNIAWAMHHIGETDMSLWDDDDAFYYDAIQFENGKTSKLKVRSLVGIIPLFAIEVIHENLFTNMKEFQSHVRRIIRTRPEMASLISRIEEKNEEGNFLFSILRGFRLEHILKRLLDEDEFLSEYGIRSLSKYHDKHPFVLEHHGRHQIQYSPGESLTGMFGGNSNWRGPIWFPINYLIIQSLRKFYKYFGPTYIYEFPTGSGNKLNLKEIAAELSKRLLKLFQRDESGKYTYHNKDGNSSFAGDEYFKDHHLFYEFFHGETGRGMGASHQTGWTALIANLILELEAEGSL